VFSKMQAVHLIISASLSISN